MKKGKSEKKISSGRVLTIEQYFKENPKSIHVLNGDKDRLGVILNGVMFEIGSVQWKLIRNIPIFHNTLFDEISIIYNFNQDKK